MEACLLLGSVGTLGLRSISMHEKKRLACSDLAFLRAALKLICMLIAHRFFLPGCCRFFSMPNTRHAVYLRRLLSIFARIFCQEGTAEGTSVSHTQSGGRSPPAQCAIILPVPEA